MRSLPATGFGAMLLHSSPEFPSPTVPMCVFRASPPVRTTMVRAPGDEPGAFLCICTMRVVPMPKAHMF
jgi:hypothetical protein